MMILGLIVYIDLMNADRVQIMLPGSVNSRILGLEGGKLRAIRRADHESLLDAVAYRANIGHMGQAQRHHYQLLR